jgi:sigma-B regulation protein RsbU (phosphoserine phosphatase)
MFVEPVCFIFRAYDFLGYMVDITFVLLAIAVPVILMTGYRRGHKECGLLLITEVFFSAGILASTFHNRFPRWIGEIPPLHFGGAGVVVGDHIASLILMVGLIAVVLYRFIRVSKDEEIAASELEAARTVQQLLIPATQPATPGFTVARVYIPARQVGGDFFLVLPADDPTDHSLLAIMGDVSGKGLQAAMVVSTIIGGLRMQISRQPAEVLAHLNRMLVGHVSGFATCCAMLLHADGRMLIANAGNPAPYSAGEEIPTLPGLPLGMVPDADYEETSHTLAPGKGLTFVSDGVIEATAVNGKELFGFDRTQSISTESAETIANAACAFGAGAPQADDITVLTIRLHGNTSDTIDAI